MKLQACLLALCILGPWTSAAPAAEPKLPLHVFYVGSGPKARVDAFAEFLKSHFTRVSMASRDGFKTAQAQDADVVLLDWSQAEGDSRKATSPFGKVEEWSKPTVLLDSAGLIMAGQWQIFGGAG
ncbi:MAG TPA: hypothetical protein VK395_13490 [Gemmataceae bacterium]|nr:hypothetical protein [Gemmataceae bacterium]